MKNTKSFSLVAVYPVGADAVTAVKLAVVAFVILADDFTKCFLKYAETVAVFAST